MKTIIEINRKMFLRGITVVLLQAFGGLAGLWAQDAHVNEVRKVYVGDLTCRTLNVSLEGVGKADIHVDCDSLSAELNGVGGVTLSGTAGKAEISKGGIGSVNTRRLKVGE